MPTREIYWNVVGEALIYPFALLALALFVRGLVRRQRLWRIGRPLHRHDRPIERLRGLVVQVLSGRRQLRDPVAGTAHMLIFYGFCGELVATSLISIQDWSGVHFLRGSFYLGYSLFADLFGIAGLVGIAMAAWRRAFSRPAHLHTVLDDWIALALLALVFVQGFAVEGLRIAASELREQPELALWSPGGHAIALALQPLGDATLLVLHRWMWWFHALTAFGFIGWVAYGKLDHIAFGLANVFTRNLAPSGKLEHFDIEAALDADPESEVSLGVGRIEGFSWKDLLDLDSCTNCGRCESVCPAHASGVPLSPRKLIRDLKNHLERIGDGSGDGIPLLGDGASGAEPPAVLEVEVWGCRTCGACQTECPVFIEHVPKLVDLRRYLVMSEAKMPDPVQQMLRGMDERMHPWAGSGRDREHWFADLDLKVFGRGDRAEYLFWVGCTGAMIDRNIAVTRATARVLKAGGVDFAVLGAEESCSGDPARRVGGELSFQTCARANIETFERYGVRKIITTCPHCFNTLRNEYPDFDGRYEVVHHSVLIDELMKQGRLRLRRELESVTYHDPCYLGRHNDVYEPPRDVVAGVSRPGALREIEPGRSRSRCCGAGGGYAWMDDAPETRINYTRIEDVKASGASTAAVSCPFCLQMFEDGLRARDPAGTIRAADIAELVAEALAD